MPIQNTRDRIARDCVAAALQLLLRRDQHVLPDLDGRSWDAVVNTQEVLRQASTREGLASAIRAIDGLPVALRMQHFCNAGHADEHLSGIEQLLRRELNQDRIGFETALEDQWTELRGECVKLLRQNGYAFEPVTKVPVPCEG